MGGGGAHGFSPFKGKKCLREGFTLAEVLITLGIIGVVAALTLPTLIKKYEEVQYKSAYKKVYSELSQVFQEALFNQEFVRTTKVDRTAGLQEFNLLKSKFKVVKDCPINTGIEKCWKKGDTICGGSCTSGNASDGIDLNNGAPKEGRASCFVDASGRSWCNFSDDENLFMVDTNGDKKPNLFGRDRWIFTFGNDANRRAYRKQDYKKVIPDCQNKDFLTQDSWCKHPPCYYYSWLYE